MPFSRLYICTVEFAGRDNLQSETETCIMGNGMKIVKSLDVIDWHGDSATVSNDFLYIYPNLLILDQLT